MNCLTISMITEIDNNARAVISLNGYGGVKFDSPTSLL